MLGFVRREKLFLLGWCDPSQHAFDFLFKPNTKKFVHKYVHVACCMGCIKSDKVHLSDMSPSFITSNSTGTHFVLLQPHKSLDSD